MIEHPLRLEHAESLGSESLTSSHTLSHVLFARHQLSDSRTARPREILWYVAMSGKRCVCTPYRLRCSRSGRRKPISPAQWEPSCAIAAAVSRGLAAIDQHLAGDVPRYHRAFRIWYLVLELLHQRDRHDAPPGAVELHCQ